MNIYTKTFVLNKSQNQILTSLMRRERNSPDNVSCNKGDEQVNRFDGLSTNNIVNKT